MNKQKTKSVKINQDQINFIIFGGMKEIFERLNYCDERLDIHHKTLVNILDGKPKECAKKHTKQGKKK